MKDELLKQSDNRIAWQIHPTKGFNNANDVATATVEEECWVAVTSMLSFLLTFSCDPLTLCFQ